LLRQGLILTEAQVIALEKAKTEKEAQGEFESECPGYCGAQDTFYVGNFIRIQTSVSPSHTQGWSRVRESRPHGSGRGAVSNDRPLYVADVWHDHFCRMARKAVSLRCPLATKPERTRSGADPVYKVHRCGAVAARI
jgi:hypothetical protein